MQVTGSVNSALTSGVEGFQKAEKQAEDAALQISRLQNAEQNTAGAAAQQTSNDRVNRNASQQPVSLTEEVVNLAVSEHLAKASANVIKTADDVMGTLIDTKV